jgi:hypothetical protein
MQINWIWLIVGFVPYSSKRQHTEDEQMLGIYALFWRLTVRWYRGKRCWSLSIPLITHVKP